VSRTDFIAIELVDGRLRYVFDVGSGVRIIRDRHRRPINDNRWHEVHAHWHIAELFLGPFCVTRSNPTHQLTDQTQPNPLEVEKFGPNPTEPNTTNKFNCVMQPNLI